MTPAETKQLLDTLSTVLDRPVPDDARRVWTQLLADVPLVWAKMAAMDLMATSPFLPKPADVITRARQLAAEERARQDRDRQLALDRAREPEPEPDPDPPGAKLVRAVLGEIAKRNKGVTSRAERRVNAQNVIVDLRHRLPVAPGRAGTPCDNVGCRCTHTEGCDAGWIETVVEGVGGSQAFPCPRCNHRRHAVLTAGDGRRGAQRALRDTSDLQREPSPW